MTVLEWVLGDNGYEVSSKEHLIQIMSYGTAYENSNKPPPSYWKASYIQTVDIDLSDTPGVKIIGTSRLPFSGIYDGGSFKISNWSIKNKQEVVLGLFSCTFKAIIKNIRMEGNWCLAGVGKAAGFLVGHCRNSVIINIETEFNDKSDLYWETAYVGGLIGYMEDSYVEGITMRGSIHMSHIKSGTIGGVMGEVRESSLAFIRNCCRFPNGIISEQESISGGVCGKCVDTQCTTLTNYMVGDIHATVSGGIIGSLETTSNKLNRCVNSMYGNITGHTCGGICGSVILSKGTVYMTDFVNYMGGNIKAESDNSGGVFGEVSSLNRGNSHVSHGDLSLTNSLCAMRGFVLFAVVKEIPFEFEKISVLVDETFGMEYESDKYSSEFEPHGFQRHEQLKDLWYCSLNYVGKGTFYEGDFVTANIGGLFEERGYTHASIHMGNVSAPFALNVISNRKSEPDITYTNYTTRSMYTNPGLLILSSTSQVIYDYDGYNILFGMAVGTFTAIARPINIVVSIGNVSGASKYRLTYQEESGRERTWVEDVSSMGPDINISPLQSETVYTLRLYTSQTSDGSYDLRETVVVTTLQASASNFNVNDFMTANNDFDMSLLDDQSRSELSKIMKDLFRTGDRIIVKLKGGKVARIDFVNLGESHPIGSSSAVLFPFDTSNGPGQSSSLILSDNTTNANVSFNEIDGTVDINGVSRETGTYFLLDGKKVLVEES